MQTILVTGADGFVGGYACSAFAARGFRVFRAGHGAAALDGALDLQSNDSIRAIIRQAKPDLVLHLAAQTFVPQSLEDPLGTYDANVMGTARLVEALRAERRPIRLLIVSSSEVYGPRSPSEMPLRETLALEPANPYAASKAAAESIAHAGRSAMLDVVIARSFNHIGPGQNQRFVVAGFAAALARVLEGEPPILRVGNLEAERDFLDVRDVVRAYVALLDDGVPTGVYNVASGTPVAIREILRQLIELAGCPVEVRVDPARLRPNDVPRFYGDATKLRKASGWVPEFSLTTSLKAIMADARSRQVARTK